MPNRLIEDRDGNILSYVGAAIAVFILIMIAITVFFNLAADVNPVSLDAQLESDGATEGGTVQNATNTSITMFNTFIKFAPVIGLIFGAVAILLAIKALG